MGSADPLKLELRSELHNGVYVLCLNKCIYHLHVGNSPPYFALTISTISNCDVKINVEYHVT